MAYIPTPTDPTQPADTVAVSTAASEFRALKLFLASLMTTAGTLFNGVVATTQAPANNSTKVATTAYSDAAAAAAAAALANQFNSSLGATGYYRLPGGFLIQWGTVMVASGAAPVVTFPIPFPIACLITNLPYALPAPAYMPYTSSLSAASMTLGNSTGGAQPVSWIALGH